MFVSTALFALAQVSRIPAAIRATSMLTLPSVRRVCEGAVAVSLVTTSFVGIAGGTASASAASSYVLDLGQQNTTQGVVNSPAAPAGGNNADAATTTTTSSTTTSTEAPATTTTAAPTTTTSSTAAPAANGNTPVAPSAGNDFVSSPRPGAPVSAPATTTTTAAPAPQTAAPAAPQTEVLNTQEHKVIAGDNLWTIARQALADSSNRNTKDLSEAEIRDYWLKVIDENRSKLRSGDPHWIFPGEVISLP